MVAVGETDFEPDVPKALCEIEGEIVNDVAFVVDQVRVTLCPEVIVVALALKDTVGAGFEGGGGVEEELPPHAVIIAIRSAPSASNTVDEK